MISTMGWLLLSESPVGLSVTRTVLKPHGVIRCCLWPFIEVRTRSYCTAVSGEPTSGLISCLVWDAVNVWRYAAWNEVLGDEMGPIITVPLRNLIIQQHPA